MWIVELGLRVEFLLVSVRSWYPKPLAPNPKLLWFTLGTQINSQTSLSRSLGLGFGGLGLRVEPTR